MKDKTIFDFCTDMEVLQFITGDKNPTRDKYAKTEKTERERIVDLYMLACITDNSELHFSLIEKTDYPLIVEWDENVLEFAAEYRQKKNGTSQNI